LGQELPCTVHFAGQTSSGRALLETSGLLFRGDIRLKIPFVSIKELRAEGGDLRIRTEKGWAIFQIGPKADQWRERILHPKSLLEKLGVKPGEKVSLIGRLGPHFEKNLKAHGAILTYAKSTVATPWTFLAADSRDDLSKVPRLRKSMKDAAALWIVYPKDLKSITERDVRGAGLNAGLTDVKVASFSPTHTALKFVIPKSSR
jgi:hypothetical protein